MMTRKTEMCSWLCSTCIYLAGAKYIFGKILTNLFTRAMAKGKCFRKICVSKLKSHKFYKFQLETFGLKCVVFL